jgi:hypothetical protein
LSLDTRTGPAGVQSAHQRPGRRSSPIDLLQDLCADALQRNSTSADGWCRFTGGPSITSTTYC